MTTPAFFAPPSPAFASRREFLRALSLAGAVYLAWRFRRPSASPLARAVRAVARTRLA